MCVCVCTVLIVNLLLDGLGISGSDAHVESTQSSPKMLRRSMRLFGSTSGGDRQFANDSESEDDSDYEPEHWKRVSQSCPIHHLYGNAACL